MKDSMPVAVARLSDVTGWARGNGLQIVLLVLGAILLGRVVRWTSTRITARIDLSAVGVDELVSSEAAKHRHALTQVATWTFLGLLYSATAIVIVQRFDIPLTGFVAPATVVGVALGFGAQQVVADLLAGFLVIAERQYGFGDLVRISVIGVAIPVLGTVEDVSLRITTLRSANGEVIITPNGQIVQVTNLSRDWARAVIDIPVPASFDVREVSEILREIGAAAFKDPDLHLLLLDAPTVMGVESIEVDQFQIRMVARTLPGKQFEVGRAIRLRISGTFLRKGINLQPGLDAAPSTRSPEPAQPAATPDPIESAGVS
jgi:small-conductance mechanosensitive channel